MPEKYGSEYESTYTPKNIEPDYYVATLVDFEYLDGSGRVGLDGKPFGDSYKLIWEIPEIEETGFWDYVPARVGVNKKTGVTFDLQATVNALYAKEVDMKSERPSFFLRDCVGKQCELHIELVKQEGKQPRNKVTKRRALKTARQTPPSRLETTNIQPRI
jgi:hypothetical protein